MQTKLDFKLVEKLSKIMNLWDQYQNNQFKMSFGNILNSF